MEAWTSTAQLKAAPDTESVAGGWSVHKKKDVGKKKKKKKDWTVPVIDPFLTVENKETSINMLPKADSVE